MLNKYQVVVILELIILLFTFWDFIDNKLTFDASRNEVPEGPCPPPCTSDADAGFVLDVFPNVTINYFCWNGIPQAKLIPAPDAVSGAPFGSPDSTIAYKVCKASIRSIPRAAQVFPYYNTQLVYGQCGIEYKCATKYYKPQ